MKKYFVLIAFVSIVIIACNQGSNESAPVETIETDTTEKLVDAAKTELMQVSALSADELKDDAVFADGSIPTSWAVAGITDVKGLKLFIKQLQQWVMTNDKENLAAVIKYPLNKTIKTKEELLANYDKVFTKEVKLSFATINFNQLFRNVNGVMTKDGQVWMAQKGKDFKIIAINYEHDHNHAH